MQEVYYPRKTKSQATEPFSMGKPNPAASLAHRMVAFLEARRETGPAEYMLPRQDLVDETRDGADDATVKKALGSKEFKARVVLANASDPAAPAALQEDLQAFAESASLLNYLKSRAPSANGQPHLVHELKKGIAGGGKAAELKKAFDAAIREKIENGAVRDVAPKKLSQADLSARLAQDLVKVLESQRRLGDESYPLSLRRLVDLAGADPTRDEKLIAKALSNKKAFKDCVMIAWNNDGDAPVAFPEDADKLARRPELLVYALGAARKKKKHAHSVTGLAGKLYGGHNKRLQSAFKIEMARRCDQDSLPSGVGAIMDSDWKLFFLDDMLPASERRQTGSRATDTPPVATNGRDGDGRHAPAQRPAPTATDAPSVSRPAGSEAQVAAPPFAEFARQFEEAFSRLDRRHGGHNFVSLAEMRRQLEAFPRAEFDRHLRQLRVEQRFTLSGAQSKQGLSEEVREAGILEAGHLLTYVSRRN